MNSGNPLRFSGIVLGTYWAALEKITPPYHSYLIAGSLLARTTWLWTDGLNTEYCLTTSGGTDWFVLTHVSVFGTMVLVSSLVVV